MRRGLGEVGILFVELKAIVDIVKGNLFCSFAIVFIKDRQIITKIAE